MSLTGMQGLYRAQYYVRYCCGTCQGVLGKHMFDRYAGVIQGAVLRPLLLWDLSRRFREAYV